MSCPSPLWAGPCSTSPLGTGRAGLRAFDRLLAVGAVGVIGVSTHWAAEEFVEMIVAFEKGDVARAREVNARLQPSFAYANSDTCVFSQSTKVMMRVLGVDAGECRLPLGPAPAGTEDRARAVLEALRG